MECRPAQMRDLPQLKAVYRDIIQRMNGNHIEIWDDQYPCAFFEGDIRARRLSVLVEQDEILAAFALSDFNAGEESIKWENERAKAVYLDRFGVRAGATGRGIGGRALQSAVDLAKERGAAYLRLLVVDINTPAISLYIKSGFRRAGGSYALKIDDSRVLREFGFERKI